MSVSEEQLKRELRFVGDLAARYLRALEQIAALQEPNRLEGPGIALAALDSAGSEKTV